MMANSKQTALHKSFVEGRERLKQFLEEQDFYIEMQGKLENLNSKMGQSEKPDEKKDS